MLYKERITSKWKLPIWSVKQYTYVFLFLFLNCWSIFVCNRSNYECHIYPVSFLLARSQRNCLFSHCMYPQANVLVNWMLVPVFVFGILLAFTYCTTCIDPCVYYLRRGSLCKFFPPPMYTSNRSYDTIVNVILHFYTNRVWVRGNYEVTMM